MPLSYLITLLTILILSCYYYSAIYLGTVLSNIVCLHTTERYLSSGSHIIFHHMRGSGNRSAGDSSTAGPVDGTTLLAGVGNMRGSENRGAGDLGDGATAGDRSARGVDRAVL